MPITVTNIGTAVTSANANSIAISSITVPGGSTIVCATVDRSKASSGGSIGDTHNTYTSLVAANCNASTTNGLVQIWDSVNVTALSSGTITFTFQSTNSQGCLSALYLTGIATSSPLDAAVTNKATGSSLTPSVTSGTPSVSGEVFLSWLGHTNGTFTYNQDTTNGWASPFTAVTASVSTSPGGGGGNKINSGTGTITFAPTISSSDTWAAMIIGFKPLISAPFTQPIWDKSHRLPIKAVGDVVGLLSPLVTPNPPQPFKQLIWDGATKPFPKAGGEVVGIDNPLLTPNPAQPFFQTAWPNANRTTISRIDTLTNLVPLYHIVVVYPFNQYDWAPATPAKLKLNYEPVYPPLPLYNPNPTHPFSQVNWELAKTNPITIVVEQIPVFNLPPPPPITELPHNLPFFATTGKLKSF